MRGVESGNDGQGTTGCHVECVRFFLVTSIRSGCCLSICRLFSPCVHMRDEIEYIRAP